MLGAIINDMGPHMKLISKNPKPDIIQKTALLETAHIIKSVHNSALFNMVEKQPFN